MKGNLMATTLSIGKIPLNLKKISTRLQELSKTTELEKRIEYKIDEMLKKKYPENYMELKKKYSADLDRIKRELVIESSQELREKSDYYLKAIDGEVLSSTQ